MTVDPEPNDRLELADWRRRIAELYAEVRALSVSDPMVARQRWAEVRERLYRDHPQSPVVPDSRGSFRARLFEFDPALRFEVVVEPDSPTPPAAGPVAGGLAAPRLAAPLQIELPVSAGGTMSFARIGWLPIPFPAGPRRLALYWMAGYAGGLFLPFRDTTNGRETYGAGRYVIDAAKSADLGGDAARRSVIVDFNFAFQPSCAFDPRWACPLAPPENRLDLPVRAGERID